MSDRPQTLDHLVEPLLIGEPQRITELARDDGWGVARFDFLPEKPGADAFACRMGMPRGKPMVQ